jgi:two-component system sensor histidine kinase PilS (NtrC family)
MAVKSEFQYRLQWLMFFRVIVASFFLGVAIIVQLQREASYLVPYLIYLYGLITAVYLLTIVYASLLFTFRNLQILCYVQLLIDILLITALIFITGGVNSIFSFMYSISIIAASILLYRAGGILVATAASMCYSLMVVLQAAAIIHPLQTAVFVARGYAEERMLFPIIVNITAFYLVAVLSSFIAEQARKTRIQLDERQIDIKTLQALNEDIIQSISSGLLTLDAEGKIITFNRAAEQITGFSYAQVYQQRGAEIFPQLIMPAANSDPQISAPVLLRFEAPFTRSDGKVLRLGFSYSQLRDGTGNETGTILVFQDLTPLKEMEAYVKRVDRLAAIGRLVAGIAHEVRNPLTSISGSVQVLQKNLILNDNDRRLMEIVVRESNNLNQLISNFIQFARPNSQKPELIYLKNMVEEMLQLFHNSPDCSQTLKINYAVADDVCFKADPQQFKQVLWNLLLNAAQAINHAGGAITISGTYRDVERDPLSSSSLSAGGIGALARQIEISVQDTGCGIDENDQDKIFEPFYTTKERGTGIGLDIAYRIIEEMGGTISFTTNRYEGTCFTIRIPL